jgi:homoserine acetyltransferase
MGNRFARVSTQATAIFAALLYASGLSVAQAPPGADYTIRNFAFETGEVLPELRIHYYTLGRPSRDGSGVVRNAVLVLHGRPAPAQDSRAARSLESSSVRGSSSIPRSTTS